MNTHLLRELLRNFTARACAIYLEWIGKTTPQRGDQQAVDLIVNTDGTFFILGNSRETLGTNRKVYLAKANALGQLLWAKTFGDVAEGKSLSYINSLMNFSLALNMGNFAEAFKIKSGPDWTLSIKNDR